jgi:hypothetical protein
MTGSQKMKSGQKKAENAASDLWPGQSVPLLRSVGVSRSDQK